MAGAATDTIIDTIVVILPDNRKLRVCLTSDGVNDGPSTIEAELESEYLALTHSRQVLIDGIYEEEDS